MELRELAPPKNAVISVSPDKLRELSKLGPLGCTFDIAFTWISIIVAAWISERFWNPALYVLTVMWIGGRQHSLGTLMHDASHWRLYNNRKVNDFMGEILCSWPLFFRMEAYRYRHLTHHKHTGTPQDPEMHRDRRPESRKELFSMLIRDILGLNTFKQIAQARELEKAPVTRRTRVLRALFYLSAIGVIAYLGAWKIVLMYWMIPILTWGKTIVRLRAVADHAGLEEGKSGTLYPTRTTIPNLFDRLFIAPRSVSYHTGHHVHMSVPSKNLVKLHEELWKNEAYRKQARVTRGFLALLFEFN